jgi:hypothetical protein
VKEKGKNCKNMGRDSTGQLLYSVKPGTGAWQQGELTN